MSRPDRGRGNRGSTSLDSWHHRLKTHLGITLGFFVLATLVLYFRVLGYGFVADDTGQILENPFVTNPHLWAKNFTTSVWGFHGQTGHFYRPLPFFLYWVFFRLSGPGPALFHLFQIGLCGLTAWLVYRLGSELFEGSPCPDGNRGERRPCTVWCQGSPAAFVGALLWVVHPLHVEAVTWISALPEVGVGLFYLLGFLLFIRAERSPGKRVFPHVVAAVAFMPALFFKELAISFPLMALAYWFCLGSPESWVKRLVRWLPYLGAAGIYGVARYAVLGRFAVTQDFWRVSWSFLSGALGLLGVHARLFFWPAQLTFFRTFDVRSSLDSPWPWLAGLGVVAAVVFRRREPVVSFLFLWWVIGLLPCLDDRALTLPLAADRYSYVPSVGLCLALSYLLLVRLPVLLNPRRAGLPVLGLAALVVMVLWAAKTLRTIPQWKADEEMAQAGLRQVPENPMAHVWRASVLQNEFGDFDGAQREYEAALKLKSPRGAAVGVDFWSNIGLGQVAQFRGRAEEAVEYFEKARRDRPDNGLVYDALGSVYYPRGDYARALEYFLEAVELNPQDVGARVYLGNCWMKLGKYREAREQFRAVRELDASLRQAYEGEARALEALGESGEAARVRQMEPKE